MNQSGKKFSKEAGLKGKTADQWEENQHWSPPAFFLYAPNSISRNMLYIQILSQGYIVDPAPQPCSLFVDILSHPHHAKKLPGVTDFFLFEIIYVKFQSEVLKYMFFSNGLKSILKFLNPLSIGPREWRIENLCGSISGCESPPFLEKI